MDFVRIPCHRRSIRLRGYDYAHPGAYFVTICTHGRERLLGDIVRGKVQLNALGRRVRECWLEIPKHFSFVTLDAFIVMPDHVHGIVCLRRRQDGSRPRVARFGQPPPHSLSSVVGAFKAGASKRINADRGTPGKLVWQRNYYEHVIRNMAAFDPVRSYIATNPARWHEVTGSDIAW